MVLDYHGTVKVTKLALPEVQSEDRRTMLGFSTHPPRLSLIPGSEILNSY